MKCKLMTGLIFIALMVSTAAMAQVPSNARIDKSRANCRTLYSSQPRVLKKCYAHIDAHVAREERKHNRAMIARLKVELKQQRVEAAERAKAPVVVPAIRLPVVKTAKRPRERSQRRMRIMPRLRVVHAPGSHAAAAHGLPGIGSTIRIRSMRRGLKEWHPAARQGRVIVVKNGVPLSVVHAGNTFNRFLADTSGNSQPNRVYMGIDPNAVDEVTVACLPEDQIQIWFLVPTGRLVQGDGIADQILWGHPVRVSTGRIRGVGKWKTFAWSGSVVR
jgi:hypothetical protein